MVKVIAQVVGLSLTVEVMYKVTRDEASSTRAAGGGEIDPRNTFRTAGRALTSAVAGVDHHPGVTHHHHTLEAGVVGMTCGAGQAVGGAETRTKGDISRKIDFQRIR